MSSIPSTPANRAVQRLQTALPEAVLTVTSDRGECTVEIPPDSVRRVLGFLRDDAALRFDLLSDLTVVDRFPLEPRFEVVYQLLSVGNREWLRVKTRIHGDTPRLDSVVSIWPAANMLEREVFDMFGVHFNNHPNLSRILLPDEWEGHPLRKDYPVEGYR